MKTIKHKYQQGYFAGIRFARLEALEVAKKERARVQKVCAFWALISFVVGAVLF